MEFFSSMLGERRNGCAPVDLTSSGLITEAFIAHLSQWFPGNDTTNPEVWTIGATFFTSSSWARRVGAAWAPVVPKDHLHTGGATGSYSKSDLQDVISQALNNKLFFAYRSDLDRLHVWDKTSLRRTGLAEPIFLSSVPTSEGVGTFSGQRTYRSRFVEMSGTTVLRRSEPGNTHSATPPGTGAGFTVPMPGLINEGETHWELEASLDNSTFYRIARTVIATTTVNDEVVFATGYAATGTLSEDIGTYALIPGARFIIADGDRLIMGGSYLDSAAESTISWTPVTNDPGAGNDERLPVDIDNKVHLDNFDGGPLTGLASGAIGTFYAFKWNKVYKMVRTGDVNRAYDVIPLSQVIGAVLGSIVRGIDEHGVSCIYFLDPYLGPYRIGSMGLEPMPGLRGTWARVNLLAAPIARSMFYPHKGQVHWWLSVDGALVPNLKIVLATSEGPGRGWSTATGRIAEAQAVAAITETTTVNGITASYLRPWIGLTSPDFIQRCDTESTDATIAYTATIRTRPFFTVGLLNRWGAMRGALLATANASFSVVVKLIRDMGVETNSITTNLAADGSESLVIKRFDDLVMSNATTLQVEITDA